MKIKSKKTRQRAPIYFVEIRRRIKNGKKNTCLRQNFGGFSSVEKAREYVRREGRQIIRDFARGHKQKELFFAVMEMTVDCPGWEWPIAEIALDIDGEETHWFKRLK